MRRIAAILPVDLKRTRLGLAAQLDRPLAGQPVLQRTLARLAKVDAVATIALACPADQDPLAIVDRQAVGKPIEVCPIADGLFDRYWPTRTSARKWSLGSWRGGLGGATCYDELLPAGPLLAAMDTCNASAALLAGPDWVMIDPSLCQRVIDLHLESPEEYQTTFCQAPPGLAGLVIGQNLLGELAANHQATFGSMFGYVPSRPQPDPIGRDVCVPIPLEVTRCAHRFIADTPRSRALLDAIADRLGDDLAQADALTITQAASALTDTEPHGLTNLPQQVTLELTPRRTVAGPITAQHHVTLEREDMDLTLAMEIVEQLAEPGDVALTLGGLGDAMLHHGLDQVVRTARRAGVLGIAVETDLLVEKRALLWLMDMPIDVAAVNVNADTAKTYEKVMGADRLGDLIENMQTVLSLRQDRMQLGAPTPWIVPRLVKTAQTLGDMETFYDRWVHYCGHAVIQPAQSGCGLMPEQSPVEMAPPQRRPCRQLGRRLTVHSNGAVVLCDQDWQGRHVVGDASREPLAKIVRRLHEPVAEHQAGLWQTIDLCAACNQWHRP